MEGQRQDRRQGAHIPRICLDTQPIYMYNTGQTKQRRAGLRFRASRWATEIAERNERTKRTSGATPTAFFAFSRRQIVGSSGDRPGTIVQNEANLRQSVKAFSGTTPRLGEASASPSRSGAGGGGATCGPATSLLRPAERASHSRVGWTDTMCKTKPNLGRTGKVGDCGLGKCVCSGSVRCQEERLTASLRTKKQSQNGVLRAKRSQFGRGRLEG
jgi:hypothetical protein